MPEEPRKGGLPGTGTPLWLDARRKSELSFVSHAHSDHIARHERVIATAATLRIMEHRLGPLASKLPVPYHRPFKLGDLDVELLPAGHVLGSAQIRVTRADGHRVVYTGDIGFEPSATAEPAAVAECDTLVLESTFGLPRFRFPPKLRVIDEIDAWARKALSRGVRPILYAYSLGKGQEIIHHLAARGLPIIAHPSIHDISQLYTELGVTMNVRRFDGEFLDGEVGVFPPFGRSAALKNTHPKTTAVLTGWAVETWAARRYGADIAFPLSDHADFPALLQCARQSKAREIITHHGFARELAEGLRAEGLFARAVTQAVQMELPLLGMDGQASPSWRCNVAADPNLERVSRLFPSPFPSPEAELGPGPGTRLVASLKARRHKQLGDLVRTDFTEPAADADGIHAADDDIGGMFAGLDDVLALFEPARIARTQNRHVLGRMGHVVLEALRVVAIAALHQHAHGGVIEHGAAVDLGNRLERGSQSAELLHVPGDRIEDCVPLSSGACVIECMSVFLPSMPAMPM